jgi:hypothetical protein
MNKAINKMQNFEPYAIQLEHMAADMLRQMPQNTPRQALMEALNGQPSEQLRELVDINTRRESGAFFTSTKLRDRVSEILGQVITKDAVILDPACGAGDLLIAAAQNFKIEKDLSSTLTNWKGKLFGFDIHPEFVRAAKARIVLSAMSRGAQQKPTSRRKLGQILSNIIAYDGLSMNSTLRSIINKASHVVLNPPYALTAAPEGCLWASGKVTGAAVFLDFYVAHLNNGTNVIAILPDVLRTGTRYLKWRKAIEESAAIKRIEIIGKFDTWTDIDVFLLHLCVGAGNKKLFGRWWNVGIGHAQKNLENVFEISVGPVVPHRDPVEGKWQKYITARSLSGYKEFDSDKSSSRRWSKRTFAPPFVAVRRTTRPDMKNRVVGTVVFGKKPVAVENHLIILKPRDNSIEACNKLLMMLYEARTEAWLDERIRCRHFTVSSLRELPWWD